MRTTMKRWAGLGLVLALLPLSAFAAPVSYSFTADVISTTAGYADTTSANYVANGTTFSGTLTFDFSNANPGQSSGTPGPGTFLAQSYGGGLFGLPVPAGAVFSLTGSLNTSGSVFTFTSIAAPPGSYYSSSHVSGSGSAGNSTFMALSDQRPTASDYLTTTLSLTTQSPGSLAYDSNGLPLLPSGIGQGNTFQTPIGTIYFELTSLTPAPVPLPAAGWLLVSGLGAMGAMVRRRRTTVA